MVRSIARSYQHLGMPLEDLVQQGQIGLLLAAAHFDPARGVRFATYAAPWVRGEIRRHAIRYQRIVHLGATHSERVAIRAFRSEAPDAERLSERSGLPLPRARALSALLSNREVRLDAEPSERDTLVCGTLSQRDPETLLADAEVHEELQRSVAALDARDRFIVRSRFLDDDTRTLTQLGVTLGISRERVRQLESRALTRLRQGLAGLGASEAADGDYSRSSTSQ